MRARAGPCCHHSSAHSDFMHPAGRRAELVDPARESGYNPPRQRARRHACGCKGPDPGVTMSGTTSDWRQLPRVTSAELAADLRHLGLAPGMTVLVHSSLSRLGHVVGGAEAVVDALVTAVAPGGTVLFPTLTGSERDGPDCPPQMDVRRTACWTGRIPECARQRSEARRSLH